MRSVAALLIAAFPDRCLGSGRGIAAADYARPTRPERLFTGQISRRDIRLDTINLYEAKTQLSRLIERAAAGEEIVIAKAGRPVARLVPLAKSGPRRLDVLAGQVRVGPDFDAPLPSTIAAAFKGEAT